MTKTLTKQWREGTLPAGCYYVLSTEDDTPVACDIDVVCDFMIRDVIAPVPDYDKHIELIKKTEQLEKKLEMAKKALKEINNNYRFTVAQDVVYKALKEMERVK